MSIVSELINQWRTALSEDFTTTWLKTAIVLWAILVVLLVIFVIDSKWVLAGILLYEVLP